MKMKISVIFTISLLFLAGGLRPVFALEHAQKDGLFSMDIPETWHWVEYPKEIIITYPDGQIVAFDIQMVLSRNLTQADVGKLLKEADDKILNEGIKAHNGTLIDDKSIKLDGVSAKRVDFKTSPPNSIYVTYIAFFNKGYAFTITYGSADDKMRLMMEDVLATIKFGKS